MNDETKKVALQPERRTDRPGEERTERRSKRGATEIDGRRLQIPEELKDPNYVYRWAADRPGRVQQLYDLEYDVVEGLTQVHGGSQEAVGPYKMVPMRKRRDWYEEDQAEKMRAVDEVEEQLRRNQASNIAAAKAGKEDQGKFYNPVNSGMEVSAGEKSYKP